MTRMSATRFILAMAIAVSCPVLQLRAAEPTVQETREGGCSVIHIKSPDGSEKVYRVDLSRHHSPASERTEALRKWESYRLGAFVCFNTNQYTGEEFCKARDAKVYNPRQLDVAGWIAAFKEAGMKYAVLTTRHTSGFLLWDSSTTDFSVATSGNNTDVCREFVKACRLQGLVPAFYYCLWGGKGWNPQPNARAIILAQLYELATRYGEIPYFWLDMKNWAPADLNTQEIYDELKTLQPDCVVEFNQHVQDGRKIAYFPTDVVDGELTPPPATGHDPLRTVDGRKYYLPFDYCLVSQSRAGGYDYDPLGPSCWFTYGEGRGFTPSRPFPAEAVARQIRLGYQRGANNILLATAPDHSGRMRPEDVEQLHRLGQILAGNGPRLSKSISEGCHTQASSVSKNTSRPSSQDVVSLTVAPVSLPKNPRNSEAAMLQRKDGSLLLAWTEFYGGSGADHAPARIVGRISNDGGRTWGPKYTLIENDGRCNVIEVNFLRLKDGSVALFHCQTNTQSTDCRVMMRRSNDEGKTWGPATQLSPPNKYTGLTNGRCIRLKTGRMLLEAWEDGFSYCYISDDDGKTWRESQRVKPGDGCWEPACIELKDGRVMMLMRTGMGGQYKSISKDKGQTWSTPMPTTLVGTSAPVSISRVPRTGDLLAIWNHNPGTKERNPLTAAVSKDEGETWQHLRDIEDAADDAWAYPAVTWVRDHALLTYFNYKDGLSLKLRIIPMKWFYE